MPKRELGAAYVMLRLDGLRILLPQAEVPSLEPEEDVDARTSHPGAVGDYQAHPVFALSEGLDAFLKTRKARPICALLDAPGGDCYGLLCNEAALLPAAGFDFKPVPAAMLEPESPLLGIALDAEGLLCLSSAEALRRLMVRLGGFLAEEMEAA